MKSKEEEIHQLKSDVRKCSDCRKTSNSTPFVYGTSISDIFVLSKTPLPRGFDSNIGAEWIDRIPINKYRGTPQRLSKWLGLDEEIANKRLFWIQRVNCSIDGGWDYAYSHCSCKFIERALRIVDPKLIVTIGRHAAEWFFQFKKLDEVAGKEMKIKINGKKKPCVCFSHTSGLAASWRSEYEYLHRKSVSIARKIIHS